MLVKKRRLFNDVSINDFHGIDNSKSLFFRYIDEQEISDRTTTDCNDVSMELVVNCIDGILKTLAAFFLQPIVQYLSLF